MKKPTSEISSEMEKDPALKAKLEADKSQGRPRQGKGQGEVADLMLMRRKISTRSAWGP